MMNSRPLNDPRTQEAMDAIRLVYEQYDLAGGFYVVNADELGFAYIHQTSWNAHVMDRDLPQVPGHETLGLRIRARAEELGTERAKQLLEGSAWSISAMKHFGDQTVQWAKDLLRMLRQAGMHVTVSTPPVPHIVGLDQRPQRRRRS